MNLSFNKIIVALMLCVASMQCFSMDLPIKRVDGKDYYYYKVTGKSSVYGLSKTLGISRELILKYNPTVSDGVHKGAILYFPVEELDTFNPEEESTETIGSVMPADAQNSETSTDLDEKKLSYIEKKSSIALILPFNAAQDSREYKHSIDFYRGFLMAADTLKERQGFVEINAITMPSDTFEMRRMMEEDERLSHAAVIVAPEDNEMSAIINNTALKTGSFVATVLAIRDSAYQTNPFVIQTNIPQSEMYSKATDGFLTLYPDATPIVIRNISGRNEKSAFTDSFCKRMEELGKKVEHIDYEGALRHSDLTPFLNDSLSTYVVIPSSGTLQEFNKFAYAVKTSRESSASKLEIFGYPDWVAFRGEAQELLHSLEATVYSRFNDDYLGFKARNFESDFKYWYGESMVESVPSPALLGFDIGNYLIKNLRNNNGHFEPLQTWETEGIQTVIKLKRFEEQGYFNSALYLIRFMNGYTQSARVI